MRKVFHFDSPVDEYTADAAVVWCFDHRFETSFGKFLKRSGVEKADIVRVAGGAKNLASPAHDYEREFVLDQIRKSIRLHHTKRVILMVHSDCGAYGGLGGTFGGDRDRESSFLENELEKAARLIRETFPGVTADGYFVNFEGVWEPEPGAAKAPGQPSAN